MTAKWEIKSEERSAIINQIGFWNLAAISGGRVRPLPDGIEMPAGAGYVVRVHLTPGDDYTVERVFVRKGVEHPHGARERVYADQVGEMAYRASCFRSYDETEW